MTANQSLGPRLERPGGWWPCSYCREGGCGGGTEVEGLRISCGHSGLEGSETPHPERCQGQVVRLQGMYLESSAHQCCLESSSGRGHPGRVRPETQR